MLGDGESRAELERLAGELDLRGRVVFRWFVQGEELEREFAGARYAVVPSECYENLPYAVLELMARGIPVAASNLGGIPELVRDGETGKPCLDPRDVPALAERIDRLRADPELRCRLGSRAREFVLDRADAERHLREMLASTRSSAVKRPLYPADRQSILLALRG